MNRFTKFLVYIIFNVRWFLIPLYLGLVAVLFYYGIGFFNEIITFMHHGLHATMDETKMFALDSIDLVMVANLIKMIITGSYNSFVSKDHGYTNENISSGQLKVKIATSILVVSLVHLLKTFIGGQPFESNQIILFGCFLVAALVLSVIEFIHSKEGQHVQESHH